MQELGGEGATVVRYSATVEVAAAASLGGASAILRIVHLNRKASHLCWEVFLNGFSDKTRNARALKTAGEITDRLQDV